MATSTKTKVKPAAKESLGENGESAQETERSKKMTRLSLSEEASDRLVAAKSPDTYNCDLMRLMKDPDQEVRYAAVCNRSDRLLLNL